MKISIAISTFLLGLTRLAMPALAAVDQEDVLTTSRQEQEIVPPSVIAPVTPSIVTPTRPTFPTRPTIVFPTPSIIVPSFPFPTPSRPTPTRPTPTQPTPPGPPPEVRNSHLVCHRARDPKPIRPPLISLIANEVQHEYSLERCRVFYRDVELCVPATKKVRSGQNFPPVLMDLQPQELKNDFLCYSIRCREDSEAPNRQVAANQFGTYKLNLFKTRQKVCIPSWKLRDDGSPVIVE